jgi:archaellum component FlaC
MENKPAPVHQNLIKNINIISDKNHEFNVIIQNEETNIMLITANLNNNLLKKHYSEKYILSKLTSNKYLALFETIPEILEEIFHLIDLKKPILQEEENSLILHIETNHTKFKELTFNLKENKKKEVEIINDLYEYIQNLQSEIQTLKNNDNEQKKEIEFLKTNNKELKDNYENLKKQFNQFSEEINNKINKLIQPINLENNTEYLNKIKFWINPNSNIKFKLLYKMSRDGDNIQTFHKLCDNKKSPTVCLISLKDGNIIGGYTTLTWDCSGKWKKDNDSFIFNLNKNLKCEKKSNTNSIYCQEDYALDFDSFCYNENSKYSMKKLIYRGSDLGYYKNAEQLLDYNPTIELEPNEVEVFEVVIS